jgi:hypothetical protein
MNKDAKRLSNSLRNQIYIQKMNIINSKSYFDGTGYAFKKALSELRKQGFHISYNKAKCMYKIESED